MPRPDKLLLCLGRTEVPFTWDALVDFTLSPDLEVLFESVERRLCFGTAFFRGFDSDPLLGFAGFGMNEVSFISVACG